MYLHIIVIAVLGTIINNHLATIEGVEVFPRLRNGALDNLKSDRCSVPI